MLKRRKLSLRLLYEYNKVLISWHNFIGKTDIPQKKIIGKTDYFAYNNIGKTW